MKGSNLTRACRLGNYLIRNLSEVPYYLKYSFFCKQEPIELGLPWIAKSAIDFLQGYAINKDTRILELGGGGSTVYFKNRGANIKCLESSKQWAVKISNKCLGIRTGNLNISVFDYDVKNIEYFKRSAYFKQIASEEYYDIILVDNYEKDEDLRTACFYEAEKAIKQGGIIILDDSWRYEKVKHDNSAKKVVRFESIGPCRPGVTTTDIYFY